MLRQRLRCARRTCRPAATAGGELGSSCRARAHRRRRRTQDADAMAGGVAPPPLARRVLCAEAGEATLVVTSFGRVELDPMRVPVAAGMDRGRRASFAE